MTLVFMEREYTTPEEPHLGIVHIVEVTNFTPSLSLNCQIKADLFLSGS